MSDSNKPVVLFVHGAFHRPLHYRGFTDRLKEEGFTVIAPPLPTAGYDDSIVNKTHHDDVRRHHESLLPLLDEGRKAVVVAHSYGGISATAAIKDHTVAERESRGLKGGIASVIYIACLPALKAGVSLYEAGGSSWENPLYDLEEHFLVTKPEEAKDAFYTDLDKEVQEWGVKYLCPHSRKTFEEPLVYTMQDVQVPKTYVMCKQDRAVPFEVQEKIVNTTGANQVLLDCGHFPTLLEKEREQIIKLVVDAAKSE